MSREGAASAILTGCLTRCRLTRITFIALINTAHAEPLPYPKHRDGQCAGSCVQSGGFEIPAKLLALADEVIE
jgi:hypothetical protein